MCTGVHLYPGSSTLHFGPAEGCERCAELAAGDAAARERQVVADRERKARVEALLAPRRLDTMTAREPIVTEDGPGGEHYARTARLLTRYRCPACKYFVAAEVEHVPGSSLPPELRDLAAWRQEAMALEARGRAAFIKGRARGAYDAHDCSRYP